MPERRECPTDVQTDGAREAEGGETRRVWPLVKKPHVTVNDEEVFSDSNLFHQEGRKVFKEVCPMAAEHIVNHMAKHNLTATDVKRWWLHQANFNMNMLIAKRILGRDANAKEAPVILDRYANTASAGSVIAFNLYQDDMQQGEYGVLCSFGAGYSIGSLVVQKL